MADRFPKLDDKGLKTDQDNQQQEKEILSLAELLADFPAANISRSDTTERSLDGIENGSLMESNTLSENGQLNLETMEGSSIVPEAPIGRAGIENPWTPPCPTIDNRVCVFDLKMKHIEIRCEPMDRSLSLVELMSVLRGADVCALSPPSTKFLRHDLSPGDVVLNRIYYHLEAMEFMEKFMPDDKEFKEMPPASRMAMNFHQTRRHCEEVYPEDEPSDHEKAMKYIQYRKMVLKDSRDESAQLNLKFYMAIQSILEVVPYEMLINEVLMLENEARMNNDTDIEKALISEILK